MFPKNKHQRREDFIHIDNKYICTFTYKLHITTTFVYHFLATLQYISPSP